MSAKEKQVKPEQPEKVQKIDSPIYLNCQDAAWLSGGRPVGPAVPRGWRGGEEEEEDSFAA